VLLLVLGWEGEMTLPYDKEPRIGWGIFHLDNSHPFYRAAVVHDARYDDLIAGVSKMTLKEVDREFLRNCLRLAIGEAWFGNTYLPPLIWQAWTFYRLVRAWAKAFRKDLEEFKPKEKIYV